MPKLTKKFEKFLQIFKPNSEGISEWISIEEIKEGGIKWGDNGNGRHGKYLGYKKYEWKVKREGSSEKSKITHLKLNGFDKFEKYQRYIRKDIKKYYKNKPCVACGTKTNLVCDHKNDLYNDPRVLDMKTQTFDDFQSLCNGCNLRKRTVGKKTRESGKRYSALNIPQFAVDGIAFIKGNETFDKDDPNAMVGTYWYDPVYFRKEVKRINIERTRLESKKETEDLKKKIEDLEKNLRKLTTI